MRFYAEPNTYTIYHMSHMIYPSDPTYYFLVSRIFAAYVLT